MKLKVDADLFLFDLDGTVYLGDTPIPGAMETLGKLSAMGKKVCFLTNNSSKDKREYVRKLTSMGYPVDLWQIITSTMAAVQFLHTRRPSKSVYPIGTPFCRFCGTNKKPVPQLLKTAGTGYISCGATQLDFTRQ